MVGAVGGRGRGKRRMEGLISQPKTCTRRSNGVPAGGDRGRAFGGPAEAFDFLNGEVTSGDGGEECGVEGEFFFSE